MRDPGSDIWPNLLPDLARALTQGPRPLGDDRPRERQHPRIAQSEPLGYEPPNLDGITVLVVDDDADARGLIARILRDASASVTTAASAAEALKILREAKLALLISDIGMPGEDGYDLIRKVGLASGKLWPGTGGGPDCFRSIRRPSARFVGGISTPRRQAG
jgi:hypothetical protein